MRSILFLVKLALAETDAGHLLSFSTVLLLLQRLHLLTDGPLLIGLLLGLDLNTRE